MRDCQVLHPNSRAADWSTEAIRRLAVEIKLFPQDQVDSVIDEWKLFRIEDIGGDTLSDWKFMLDEDGGSDAESIASDADEPNWVIKRVDDFWAQVFKMKSSSSVSKFPNLSKLIKLCLTLSHGNADVERSFSENKLVLTSGRTRISDATLNGYRSTSSFMKKYGQNPAKLPVNQTMLKSVRNARAMYLQRIELQKQAAKNMAASEADVTLPSKSVDRKRKLEEEKTKKLKEASALKEEGMRMLNEALQKKDFNKVAAANAILERSSQLEKEAVSDETRKKAAKKN